MLWIAASLFFAGLALREVWSSLHSHEPIYKPYLVTLLCVAALLAWPPVSKWRFERFLSAKAAVLAENPRADVHCNTMFDSMLDPELLAGGHADPRTGKIVIQPPGCKVLRSYLRHPERASDHELWSLGLFTHESMHVHGEMNEVVTECMAVQRNYRAATLLGVPDDIARQNALDYYRNIYLRRASLGTMQAQYHSAECAPGGELDERLRDSTWAHP